MTFRSLLIALALLLLAAPAATADPRVDVLSSDTRLLDAGAPAGARAAATRMITPCTWSYFAYGRTLRPELAGPSTSVRGRLQRFPSTVVV